MDAEVAPEAKATLEEARKTLTTVDRTICRRCSAAAGSPDVAARTFAGPRRSLRELTDLLQRQPESLIRGKEGEQTVRYGYLWSAALFLTISSLSWLRQFAKRNILYTQCRRSGQMGQLLQAASSAYSIAVGPITLPEVVDRPQIVLRAGPNEVTFVELHRWAGPLKSEIPRIIADNLAAELNVKRVAAYPQSARGIMPTIVSS